MVLITDDNSARGAHVKGKQAISVYSRCKQMPSTDQITEITPNVRTYFGNCHIIRIREFTP